MFRARPGPEPSVETADGDAVVELVRRIRRLSRAVLALAFALALPAGAATAVWAMEGYRSVWVAAQAARGGIAFCIGAGVIVVVGMGLRTLLLRWLLPRWIGELAARGVDPGGLAEAVAPFL